MSAKSPNLKLYSASGYGRLEQRSELSSDDGKLKKCSNEYHEKDCSRLKEQKYAKRSGTKIGAKGGY